MRAQRPSLSCVQAATSDWLAKRPWACPHVSAAPMGQRKSPHMQSSSTALAGIRKPQSGYKSWSTATLGQSEMRVHSVTPDNETQSEPLGPATAASPFPLGVEFVTPPSAASGVPS